MYLALYDISGIQKFVFASGILKEQVGGSIIVHHILYDILPAKLSDIQKKRAGKEQGELFAWKEHRQLSDFGDRNYNIVYIGGGNASVLYNDKDFMLKVTRELEKEVLILTGNKLKLCYAFIQADESEKYINLYHKLMNSMVKVKYSPSNIKLISGIGIGEYDSISLEPITLCENEKTKKYGVSGNINKISFFNEMTEQDEFIFTKQFEDFRREDRKSFIAVIHIDGDSMGKQLLQIVDKLSQDNKSLYDVMLEIRDISEAIDALYKNTMRQTLNEIFGEQKNEIIPFRNIISDGDDITCIIEAERAFEFVEVFMRYLKKEKEENNVLKDRFFISASAGIAFVHDKYPFDEAYEMALQLCESAKKVKKDREDEYKYISSMDFHIVTSGIKRNLKDFRKTNYKKGDTQLNIRPYFYDDKDDPHSYGSFKALRKIVKNRTNVAGNKLKGLRNAYGNGMEAAKKYHDFILSRDKFGITGKAAEQVFYGDDWEQKACFFDALDSMDI